MRVETCQNVKHAQKVTTPTISYTEARREGIVVKDAHEERMEMKRDRKQNFNARTAR